MFCQHRKQYNIFVCECSLINRIYPSEVCICCEKTWENNEPPTEINEFLKNELYIIECSNSKGNEAQQEPPIPQSDPPASLDNTPHPPSLLRMATTYISSQIENIKSRMVEVSDKVYQERLEICNNCEHYKNNTCGVCGCKLGGDSTFTSKLKLPHERCPIGKWNPAV